MKTETIFQEVMGNSPTTKVLEYFVSWNGYDVTISDISRKADVSRTKVYEIVDNLLKTEVISKTRKVGASEFYNLNKESPVTKQLTKLFKTIVMTTI